MPIARGNASNDSGQNNLGFTGATNIPASSSQGSNQGGGNTGNDDSGKSITSPDGAVIARNLSSPTSTNTAGSPSTNIGSTANTTNSSAISPSASSPSSTTNLASTQTPSSVTPPPPPPPSSGGDSKPIPLLGGGNITPTSGKAPNNPGGNTALPLIIDPGNTIAAGPPPVVPLIGGNTSTTGGRSTASGGDTSTANTGSGQGGASGGGSSSGGDQTTNSGDSGGGSNLTALGSILFASNTGIGSGFRQGSEGQSGSAGLFYLSVLTPQEATILSGPITVDIFYSQDCNDAGCTNWVKMQSYNPFFNDRVGAPDCNYKNYNFKKVKVEATFQPMIGDIGTSDTYRTDPLNPLIRDCQFDMDFSGQTFANPLPLTLYKVNSTQRILSRVAPQVMESYELDSSAFKLNPNVLEYLATDPE